MTVKSFFFFLLILLIYTSCGNTPKESAEEYPLLMEIVGDSTEIDDVELLALCEKHGVSRDVAYGWENRRLIYGMPENKLEFEKEMTTLFPAAEIKVYESPYYIFDRSRCGDEPIARPWARKIWTANLVADPAMQQEYMDYHKHQFEQFPEVSAGFCRAEFQQLIMYRNGRQLILIISYPAGKDYDTLNARTVENNPRVDEWNSIMGKYQEGIEGSPFGSVWVPFEPVF